MHVEAVDAVHAKVSIDSLAVCHRRLGGIGIGAMSRNRRFTLFNSAYPERFPRIGIETGNLVFVTNVHQVISISPVSAIVFFGPDLVLVCLVERYG